MQGEFSLEGRYPEVRSNVKLVQGLFNESLPKFIKSYYKVRNPVDITYLHIDCDLYQGKLLSHHMPNAKCHRICLHQHTHQTISQNKVLKAMMAAMFGYMHIHTFSSSLHAPRACWSVTGIIIITNNTVMRQALLRH